MSESVCLGNLLLLLCVRGDGLGGGMCVSVCESICMGLFLFYVTYFSSV